MEEACCGGEAEEAGGASDAGEGEEARCGGGVCEGEEVVGGGGGGGEGESRKGELVSRGRRSGRCREESSWRRGK